MDICLVWESRMWVRKELLDATLDFQCLRAGHATINHPYFDQRNMIDCHVISVVKKGAVTCHFYNPEQIFDVKPGDAVLTPAWRERETHAPDMLHCGWLHFRFVFLGGFDYLSFFDLPLSFHDATARGMGVIQQRLATLCAQSETMGYKDLAMIKIEGFRLLELILKHAPMRIKSENLLQELTRLDKALECIRHEYDQPLTVASLAKKVNMSRARFHVHFENTLGVSPMRYVRIKRMEKAKELLLTTDMDMAHIAQAVGYADPFHFSRNFRKTVGISPRGYRQRQSINMY